MEIINIINEGATSFYLGFDMSFGIDKMFYAIVGKEGDYSYGNSAEEALKNALENWKSRKEVNYPCMCEFKNGVLHIRDCCIDSENKTTPQ